MAHIAPARSRDSRDDATGVPTCTARPSRLDASGSVLHSAIHMTITLFGAPGRLSYAAAFLLLAAIPWSAAEGHLPGLPAQPGHKSAIDTLHLTLARAVRMARGGNPELIAARLDTAVAIGERRQAASLAFNPSVDALLPVGSLGSEIGVTQEVEVFGQRGLRRHAAQAALEAARFGVREAERLVTADVERAFFRLVAATRRTELAGEILTLNERLADVAKRQLDAGEISKLDYNLTLIELGRSRSRLIAAQRERKEFGIALGRLVGLSATTPVAAALDSATASLDVGALARMSVDSLAELAIRNRPDVSAHDARLSAARALVVLARRSALPNFLARAVVERTDGRVATRPGIGVTLPILNRNRGSIAARQAEALRLQAEGVAVRSRVRAEVASALSKYQSAASEIEILESTVLEPARQNRQLLEVSYREGEIGLPVLLLIRNQVIDAELEYWAAWVEAREARTALEQALNVWEFEP